MRAFHVLTAAAVVAAIAVGSGSNGQARPASEVGLMLAAARTMAAPGAQQLVPGPGDPRFLDASLPLLPDNLPSAPRPAEYVRAVYAFAAAHQDILRYVPCFCGCDRMGHRSNDECFVARRSPTGKVLAWEPHGVICEVCLDVAHQAMQLHSTGASVAQIRAEIDRKWTVVGGSHTNTPMPPSRGGGD